ncbi:hypothetical protein DFH05DRAFT_1615274 [Lentinula detonsa]|uniref:Secreted protein n=1 Tax=Lentinula detonsa TaxID=2804962 RepID=A0A9W8TXF6_9AGAR|nr:hypothetical protein DFH05DRAFT_1615274 [Lentinula detonsa]
MRVLRAGSIILIQALISSTLTAPAHQKDINRLSTEVVAYNLPFGTFPTSDSIEGETHASGGSKSSKLPQARAFSADQDGLHKNYIKFIEWDDKEKKGFVHKQAGAAGSTAAGAPQPVRNLLYAFVKAWNQREKERHDPRDNQEFELIYDNGYYDVLENGFALPDNAEFSFRLHQGYGECRGIIVGTNVRRPYRYDCTAEVGNGKITLSKREPDRKIFEWDVPEHLWCPGRPFPE